MRYGMKISGKGQFPKHAGAIVAVAYGYGLLLGGFGLVWSWATGRNLAQLEWWQYLFAPLAIGAAAFVLEAVGTFLKNGFAFGQAESPVRLAAGKVVLVVLIVLLLIGWPMYEISQR